MNEKSEYHRIQSRKWRAANRERHRASVRAWKKANPEKVREKDLRNQAARTVRQRAAREARLLETTEARAAAKIACAERRRAAARVYYVANRERICETSKAWRAANPGKSAILQKAWKDKNPEKVRALKRARKVAKRAMIKRDLMKLQRGRCAYCREKLGVDTHVDHVMPLKRGGPDKRSNLQLTCAPCNLTKNARHPITFAQSLGMLL